MAPNDTTRHWFPWFSDGVQAPPLSNPPVDGPSDATETVATDDADTPVAGAHALAEALRVDAERAPLEAQNVQDEVAAANGSNVHADFTAEERYFGVGDKLQS